VAQVARGYIYYVSLKGVTGRREHRHRRRRGDGEAHPRAHQGPGGRGLRHPRRRDRPARWQAADAVVIGSRIVQDLATGAPKARPIAPAP
jgi:tryptophan synthase alpha chain